VLISGGRAAVDGEGLLTAELYSPTTQSSLPTGAMQVGRVYHTVTRLPSDRVQVLGGTQTRIAEMYDPTLGTFSNVGELNVPRRIHTATLLPNGKVLVAGGTNGNGPLASAELITYIPSNFFSGTLDVPSGWISTPSAIATFSGTTSKAALDAGSLSNDSITWSDWIPAVSGLTVTSTWNFGSDGANKPVYLRLRDVNGGVATVVTGTVNVDTTKPTGSVMITRGAPESVTAPPATQEKTGKSAEKGTDRNSGSGYVCWPSHANTDSCVAAIRTANVTLHISATDETSGVASMEFSNNPDFAGASWEPFATSRAWALDTNFVVYARFMDHAGNISQTYSAELRTVSLPFLAR
jgi:hypothetical protein